MTRKDFELGHRLLIKERHGVARNVFEVTVLEVAKTCVLLLYRGGTRPLWKELPRNHDNYTFQNETGYWDLLEDLGMDPTFSVGHEQSGPESPGAVEVDTAKLIPVTQDPGESDD